MSNYLMQGDIINVTSTGAMQMHTTLPVGVYTVEIPPMQGPHLKMIHDLEAPGKIYGSAEGIINRIVSTYMDRSHSTGVLLAGVKGTGKTMIARGVCNTLATAGIPTIVIPYTMVCPQVVDFIDTIDCPCVVLFDEIDKIGSNPDDNTVGEGQNCLLGLFDGISNCKRLYILTANDTNKINPQLLNRPGRIYYKVMFGCLEEDTITEYCDEKLINKEMIKDIQQIATRIRDFSFDILQALVEECNRYGVTPKEACKYLNVSPDSDGMYKIQVFRKDDGSEVKLHYYYVFRNLCMEDPECTTDIVIYDEKIAMDYINGLEHNEDKEYYLNRMKTKGIEEIDCAQVTLRFRDDSYTSVKKGSFIYEDKGYTIKATPFIQKNMTF